MSAQSYQNRTPNSVNISFAERVILQNTILYLGSELYNKIHQFIKSEISISNYKKL